MRACGSPASASCSASIERDFPIPASPITVTIWPSPWRAMRQRSSINPISWARPISGRSAAGADRGKAAFDRCFAPHAPGRHRAGKALQFVFAGGFELEQPAQQILRRFADENGVRSGERLQPRGEIGRFADNGALLRRAGADDFADDDQTGGDADPGLDRRAVRQFDAADFGQHRDRGANGAFRRHPRRRGENRNRPERRRP